MWKIERASGYGREIVKQNSRKLRTQEGCAEVEYLTFPALEECGIVEHLFTTREGGVSEGIWGTMNFSFQRGDCPEHVLENYRRIGQILGCNVEDMVASRQTHTTNIRVVKESDRGMGVVKEAVYQDVDGLITNRKGIALVCSFADCVPLYFVDVRHEAIGLAHSGWRGTVAEMGPCMIQAMEKEFGTRPEDVWAAVGPSICQDCYEVSEDVAKEFEELVTGKEHFLHQIWENGSYRGKLRRQVLRPGRTPGKYQLDLWLANLLLLQKAGVLPEHISVTDVCTCHNAGYLHSHRASQGKRGNLAAFLMLKNS